MQKKEKQVTKTYSKIWNWIKGYMVAGILILLSMAFLNLCFGRVCLFRIFTGLPCPGCGMTRALILFLTGHPSEAMDMHPLVIFVVSFPVICLILKKVLKNYLQFIKCYGIILLIVFIVVYIWRMIQFFPDRVPYIYDKDNLIRYIIQIIQKVKIH